MQWERIPFVLEASCKVRKASCQAVHEHVGANCLEAFLNCELPGLQKNFFRNTIRGNGADERAVPAAVTAGAQERLQSSYPGSLELLQSGLGSRPGTV